MTYASPANEHWYVGVESGPKRALLVGPFDNHSDAAKWVEPTRLYTLGRYRDMDSQFATFGVARVISDTPRDGRLNDFVLTSCYYCGQSTTDDPEGEYGWISDDKTPREVGVGRIAHAGCMAVRE